MATTCALCLKSRPLRRSHIVPEFLYKPGYDELHRLREVRADISKITFKQKGVRESLLCQCCESLLNENYEQPISRQWERLIPAEIPDGHDSLKLFDLDYAIFKLFHLSILWRASVAREKPWQHVSLGSKHEHTIRTMLIERDPAEPLQYPFLGNVMLAPGTRVVSHGTMLAPVGGRFNASRVYMFIYGGCSWHFVVSSHLAVPSNAWVLSSSGEIQLGVRDLTSNRAFDKHMKSHFAARGASGNTGAA